MDVFQSVISTVLTLLVSGCVLIAGYFLLRLFLNAFDKSLEADVMRIQVREKQKEQDRLRAQQPQNTLLRAGMMEDTQPQTLVRPAMGTEDAAPETLLRSGKATE